MAGYARVSTDEDSQTASYEAQIQYYEEYIRGHEDWEFVGMYSDEGISGTQTKHREGFRQMVEDALSGKINLILTKSVSRFARNTVDSLTTIRLLKENNIEVYFEKENIFTFDGKGELLLTIMSSIAQEESRSISENVKWGMRKRFENGKHSAGYGTLLGYDQGPGGELVVNRKQAKVVRLIFELFLEGRTYTEICRELESRGCETGAGRTKWSIGPLKHILTNEKYRGDALLQKYVTTDFLTHRLKKNTGEAPQYYIENDHEAIVAPETFDRVQAEMALRRRESRPKSRRYVWSGMLQCGECGGWYGPKIWHSTSRNATVVFECNGKYYKKLHCSTPTVHMDVPEQIFLRAYQMLLERRTESLREIRRRKLLAQDTAGLERRKEELLAQGVQKSSAAWYEVEGEILLQRMTCRDLRHLARVVRQGEPLEYFSEEKFRELCDRIIFYENYAVVRFKGGYEVKVPLLGPSREAP